MADTKTVEQVWKMMENIRFCMLATHDGTRIRSRPMTAHVSPDEKCIYFLTDADSAKDDEVRAHPEVNLAFADPSGQDYVSVSGAATVSNDRAKIRELFSTPAKAWWDNAEDPAIRVLKVTPHDADWWDGPGTIGSYIKMAAAAVSDSRPDLGDSGTVSFDRPA